LIDSFCENCENEHVYDDADNAWAFHDDDPWEYYGSENSVSQHGAIEQLNAIDELEQAMFPDGRISTVSRIVREDLSNHWDIHAAFHEIIESQFHEHSSVSEEPCIHETFDNHEGISRTREHDSLHQYTLEELSGSSSCEDDHDSLNSHYYF
jgi:hypothetical protein